MHFLFLFFFFNQTGELSLAVSMASEMPLLHPCSRDAGRRCLFCSFASSQCADSIAISCVERSRVPASKRQAGTQCKWQKTTTTTTKQIPSQPLKKCAAIQRNTDLLLSLRAWIFFSWPPQTPPLLCFDSSGTWNHPESRVYARRY